jgi:hypothetical protein
MSQTEEQMKQQINIDFLSLLEKVNTICKEHKYGFCYYNILKNKKNKVGDLEITIEFHRKKYTSFFDIRNIIGKHLNFLFKSIPYLSDSYDISFEENKYYYTLHRFWNTATVDIEYEIVPNTPIVKLNIYWYINEDYLN